MYRFFLRHVKDAELDNGKKPYEDKGYQAHKIWGGDAGKRWATKVYFQMKRADGVTKKRINEIIKETINNLKNGK